MKTLLFIALNAFKKPYLQVIQSLRHVSSRLRPRLRAL